MPYIGAIDQGTTSSRFLIFDGKGKLVAQHVEELDQFYPKPGWVEHDPHEILDSVRISIEKACRRFELMGHRLPEIRAIGITNQRETTLVWDRNTGEALCKAVVWSDTRTQDIVKELAKKSALGTDAVKEKTGLPISNYFSAVKLKWLLENVPDVKKAAAEERLMFGTVDSWLLYNLTGGVDGGIHVTDVTNASRTLLMNLKTLQWDEELLDFFGIPAHVLPTIVTSSELYGCIEDHDILQGIPITGCLGDQQAALVGQKCFQEGEAKNTYGTGAFLLFNTGNKPVISRNGLLTTVAYQFGPDAEPAYALEGSIASAGSAVKWIRDNLGMIRTADEIGKLAAQVRDTGGVYFVTAFSGLFAPYWRDDARGTIIGITNFTNKYHIARATLEATCFQTKAILDAIKLDSGSSLKTLKVDGGMSNSNTCMQIQADVLGIPVDRPAMRETTSLGAAFAAGMAVGVWSSFDDLKYINVRDRTEFRPSISEQQRDEKYKGWVEAVKRSYGLANCLC